MDRWISLINEEREISVEDLKSIQFSTSKAEYVIGIAKEIKNGSLTKEALLEKQEYHQIKDVLMSIRGIGAWTANLVMMRCLHIPTAIPIADVGLHRALKQQLNLDRKPSPAELEELAASWEGWQAYANFYLWRSLYD
ncbi:DNA-3-methyladenine glycosylase 2 family protein [Bacillaceae bacterium Marseille-Q3522]|nr:DNA-3-methyladenine glycosylase 2 family protein [Bacillaceae bacterium Marseille-Q3522]